MDGATVRITGSFQLSLWAWDATLTDQGHTETIQTGSRQSPLLPAQAPDASTVFAHDQESYLFVTNGTLTTTLTGSDYKLYAGSGSTLAASDLRLEGATGHLQVGGAALDVNRGTVSVDGQTAATLHGALNAPLRAQLKGTPAAVSVDGHSLSVSATPVAFKVPWWGVAGLVATPVFAVPLLRKRFSSARRRRLRELKERSQELANRLHYEEAASVLQEWEALEPNNLDLQQQWATVLAGQGDLHGAWSRRERMEKLGLLDASGRAENCLQKALLARLLAMQSGNQGVEWQQRAQWNLQEAVQLSPGLLLEATRHPTLRPLAYGIDPAFA